MASLFSQFQVLQSGHSGPDEKDLPIDLTWKTLSAWLVDCKLIRRDTLIKYNISRISERSLELLADLSSESSKHGQLEKIRDVVSTILDRQELVPWMYSYHDFQSIFRTLEQHSGEPTTKSLLGNFHSAFLHSWDQVNSQWTKGNSHLAHDALVLFQAVKHEIPCLKTAVERNQRFLQTISAKSSDLSSTISSETRAYESMFQKHGLTLIPVTETDSTVSSTATALESQLFRELTAVLSASLPGDAEVLLKSLKESKKLIQAYEYMNAWTRAIQGEKEKKILEALSEVMSVGAECLLAKHDGKNSEDSKQEQIVDEDAIDWGDFDVEVSPSNESAEIDLVIALPNSSASEKDHIRIRKALETDLDVMMAFFKQRAIELSSRNEFLDLVMGRALAVLPEQVTSHDNIASIQGFIEAIKDARAALDEFLKKANVLENDESRRQVVSSIIQKRTKIGQLQRSLDFVLSKRAEIELTLSQSAKKSEVAKSSALALARSLESSLSLALGGRTINISVPSTSL